MAIGSEEILETLGMIHSQHLDIRTVTLGIDLLPCADPDVRVVSRNVYERVMRLAERLVPVSRDVEQEYGIPIINKRVSITPVAWFAAACRSEDYLPIAHELDRAARELGIDFIGGWTALIHKEMSRSSRALVRSIPGALAATTRLCSSVSIGSTKAGINMDAVSLMGQTVKDLADLTADQSGAGCARLVVFCNAVEDNPFMAGAFSAPGKAIARCPSAFPVRAPCAPRFRRWAATAIFKASRRR